MTLDPSPEAPQPPAGDNSIPTGASTFAGVFYRTRWRSADPLWAVAFLAIYLGLGWSVSRFSDFSHLPGTRFFLLVLLLGLEAGIPILVVSMRRRSVGEPIDLKKRTGDLLAGCGTYLIILPGLLALSLVLNTLYPETLADRIGILKDKSFAFQVVLGLAAFTIVPICEEVFFRGFLYNALRVHLRPGSAILLQAAIFGSLHLYTPTYPLYIFWVGIGLGWVYEKRKRLLAPIVTHICFNILGSFLVLFSAYFNQHQPAATWEQAQDILHPPAAELRYLVERELEAVPPEELMEQIEMVLGKEGLGIWKLEAEAYRTLAETLDEGDPLGGRAGLRAARLYFDQDDPRRALLLVQEVQTAWRDDPAIQEQAAQLSREIGLALMLENPEADILDLGATPSETEEP